MQIGFLWALLLVAVLLLLCALSVLNVKVDFNTAAIFWGGESEGIVEILQRSNVTSLFWACCFELCLCGRKGKSILGDLGAGRFAWFAWFAAVFLSSGCLSSRGELLAASLVHHYTLYSCSPPPALLLSFTLLFFSHGLRLQITSFLCFQLDRFSSRT